MKKLLLPFLLFLCLGTSAEAQTLKGSKLIGGSGNLHFSTDSSPLDYTSFSFTPRLGAFVADNLALGVGIPLLYVTTTNDKNTSVGVEPFARGYFGQSATRLFLEGRVGLNHLSYKYIDTYNDDIFSDQYFTYGVGAGVVHFLNEYVGLELILSYDQSEMQGGPYTFNNNTGINLNIGLQIHLPGKG